MQLFVNAVFREEKEIVGRQKTATLKEKVPTAEKEATMQWAFHWASPPGTIQLGTVCKLFYLDGIKATNMRRRRTMTELFGIDEVRALAIEEAKIKAAKKEDAKLKAYMAKKEEARFKACMEEAKKKEEAKPKASIE
jgi:hypothetical protein